MKIDGHDSIFPPMEGDPDLFVLSAASPIPTLQSAEMRYLCLQVNKRDVDATRRHANSRAMSQL
jgi:hypothetical protein